MNSEYVNVRSWSMDGFDGAVVVGLLDRRVGNWLTHNVGRWLREVVVGLLDYVVLNWLVVCWWFCVYTMHLFLLNKKKIVFELNVTFAMQIKNLF